MINSYYEISKDEWSKLQALIQKEEFEMDKLENEHRNDINAFINKFKHLEYDHDTFINKILVENSENAVKDEEKIRLERENNFMQKKGDLKKDIKERTDSNRNEIKSKQENLDNRYKKAKDELERRLLEIKQK